MKEIIIVDRAHPALQDKLIELGYNCSTDLNFTYNAFLHNSDDFSGLIIRSKFVVDEAIIDSKPSLKFIVRLGSGVENIDVKYAESKGIKVISTPDGNANAVAEHCLALLMAGLRHISVSDREVRRGEWLREKNKGSELRSHTYGIIGYGHTGPAFAKILASLGCEVLAYDKYNPCRNDGFAIASSIDDIREKCDVISVQINYLPENHHFINDMFFNSLSKGIIFLNTSRGAVVDTKSLVGQLQRGKVLFAGLDVLEYENTRLRLAPKEEWNADMDALAKMDNVVLTPHVGGQTKEAELRHAEIALREITALDL